MVEKIFLVLVIDKINQHLLVCRIQIKINVLHDVKEHY